MKVMFKRLFPCTQALTGRKLEHEWTQYIIHYPSPWGHLRMLKIAFCIHTWASSVHTEIRNSKWRTAQCYCGNKDFKMDLAYIWPAWRRDVPRFVLPAQVMQIMQVTPVSGCNKSLPQRQSAHIRIVHGINQHGITLYPGNSLPK